MASFPPLSAPPIKKPQAMLFLFFDLKLSALYNFLSSLNSPQVLFFFSFAHFSLPGSIFRTQYSSSGKFTAPPTDGVPLLLLLVFFFVRLFFSLCAVFFSFFLSFSFFKNLFRTPASGYWKGV